MKKKSIEKILPEDVKQLIKELNDKRFTVDFIEKTLDHSGSPYYSVVHGYLLACFNILKKRYLKKLNRKGVKVKGDIA